jgi:prepilin-type N-terminal cleavage/methylation domain-containing protein
MSTKQFSDDFVEGLLAQDSFFASPELAEQRRKIIDRLNEAGHHEKRARRFVLTACAICFVIVGSVFAGAAFEIMHAAAWPDWARIIVALVVLLSPMTVLLLVGLYLFRYRWELVSARKAARRQALAEIPRQISELRHELEELRKQTSKRPGAGAGTGFTLIEMLMVLGVLTILTSLLLPGLASAKARARIVTCKNNLGQMGKALTMYEADFRYFPGVGNDKTPIGKPPWFVLSEESWLSKITPYLATNSPIFTCPEYRPLEPDSQCYGYNAGGSCEMNYPPYTLGLGLGKGFPFIASSGVKVPADMIALGDLQLPRSLARFVITPWHKHPLGGLDSVIPPRHAGGSVLVFLDAHVEWLKRPRWIAETDSVRSRWNNDHEPHRETW